jgi:hypothetical protein
MPYNSRKSYSCQAVANRYAPKCNRSKSVNLLVALIMRAAAQLDVARLLYL